MFNSFYPVIMTASVQTNANFYCEHFGFKPTFESDWYISLKSDNGFEIAFIDATHETIPLEFASNAKGILLNFEVDNAHELYQKFMNTMKNEIVLHLRDEPFGQRHFILKDPNGLLLDVIQIIPPSEEFLSQYK